MARWASTRPSVGLVYAKRARDGTCVDAGRATSNFAIPPGDANYQVDRFFEFGADAKVVTLIPHMHLRGKDFEFRASVSDGRTQFC